MENIGIGKFLLPTQETHSQPNQIDFVSFVLALLATGSTQNVLLIFCLYAEISNDKIQKLNFPAFDWNWGFFFYLNVDVGVI